MIKYKNARVFHCTVCQAVLKRVLERRFGENSLLEAPCPKENNAC